MNKQRCSWPNNDPLMCEYHDKEWGVPLHDDQKLFEFMVLDAFQAGLSWRTILYRRKGFKKAFDNFNPQKIALYKQKDYERLLKDASIIRNRAKIQSTIGNAKAFLEIQKEFGSFDKYIWQFVGNVPKINKWQNTSQIPSYTKESDNLSQDLIKRGFKFVGSTICYAFMQAAGLVNDHQVSCFRYKELSSK